MFLNRIWIMSTAICFAAASQGLAASEPADAWIRACLQWLSRELD